MTGWIWCVAIESRRWQARHPAQGRTTLSIVLERYSHGKLVKSVGSSGLGRTIPSCAVMIAPRKSATVPPC